ncbi:MAG TPA: C4-dicarboxylate ABC transporter [Gammaproteobacteria bacterium]|nr:C4-dicarboxylate ABC transporter [Gammaproteobacteria bacterium]
MKISNITKNLMMKLAITLFFLVGFTSLQAKTFKIATDVPDGTFWMKKMRSAAKTIKNKTDGRVKFKFYPGGIMGSERVAMKKIRISQLQGAFVANGVLSSIYPDSQVYALPKLFNNIEEVDYIRNKFDKKITDGLKDKKMISFGLIETGFAYILSTKKINKEGNLSSYKVWSPTGNKQIELTLNAIGVTPIPLNIGDVLTALQTNLIDTVIVPPVVAITLQWHTQVKFFSNVPLMYIYGTFLLSKKDFDKISKGDQEVVRHAMSTVLSSLDQKNRSDNIKALKALKKQGIEDSSPSNGMLKHWVKKGENAREIIKSKNIMSKNIIEDVIKQLEKYREQQEAPGV